MTITNSTSVVFTTDAHNDRYRKARQRLADRTAAISERLEDELGRTQQRHEVDWRSLLFSQRRITERIAAGSPPDPRRFWNDEASPLASAMVDDCGAVIDAHLLLLWDAVSVFLSGVLPDLTTNGQPPSEGALSSLRSDVEVVLQPVMTLGLDRSPLDRLGERWHERLRRQAIRRHLRSGGDTDAATFAARVDEQELRMLLQPPWSQADQLLSAFELAHVDVRQTLQERIDRMLTDIIGV